MELLVKKTFFPLLLATGVLVLSGCDNVKDDYHDAFWCGKVADRLNQSNKVEGAVRYMGDLLSKTDKDTRRELTRSEYPFIISEELEGELAGYNLRGKLEYLTDEFESSKCRDVYSGKY